jgi:hypothetical protein
VTTVARSRPAGQAPGVVKIRLSGAPADITALASLLGSLAGGIDLIDVSQPYPNRRDAGARLYLTIRLAAVRPGTGAQPPARPATLPQLTVREDS